MESLKSPFGGDVVLVKSFEIKAINQLYLDKCGLDVAKFLLNSEDHTVHQMKCKKTGYKFWYPFGLAGSEEFYASASGAWPNYYKTDRWEYDVVENYVEPGSKVLEIGCGRGYFLRRMEARGVTCAGIELNSEAIAMKVCNSEVYPEAVEEHVKRGFKYDVVASFQVLEHLEDPMSYLKLASRLLNENGRLIISTPNDDFIPHRNYEDAFNFPPHHVGHYNKQIFEKIGELMQLDVISIRTQKADFRFPRFGSSTEKSFVFRVFRKLCQKLGESLLHLLSEPGHTIVCLYEKK